MIKPLKCLPKCLPCVPYGCLNFCTAPPRCVDEGELELKEDKKASIALKLYLQWPEYVGQMDIRN